MKEAGIYLGASLSQLMPDIISGISHFVNNCLMMPFALTLVSKFRGEK